jgi:hypothetical protein
MGAIHKAVLSVFVKKNPTPLLLKCVAEGVVVVIEISPFSVDFGGTLVNIESFKRFECANPRKTAAH